MFFTNFVFKFAFTSHLVPELNESLHTLAHEPLRIVINTHIAYAKPLSVLFGSLGAASFSSWEAVVLVVGGALVDSAAPERRALLPLLRELCGAVPPSLLGGAATVATEVTLIWARLANFDYHGLSALSRHHRDPLLAATHFLYLLDTSTVAPRFVASFDALREERKRHDPEGEQILTTLPLPSSNICVVGARVVARLGANFDVPLTKMQALILEHGTPVCVVAPPAGGDAAAPDHAPDAACAGNGTAAGATATTVQPLVAFGEVEYAGMREDDGEDDIYGTGWPRRRWSIASFGVTKHVLMWAEGDILSNGTNVRRIPRLRAMAHIEPRWLCTWVLLMLAIVMTMLRCVKRRLGRRRRCCTYPSKLERAT